MAFRDDMVEGEFAGIRVYWPRSELEFGHRNAIRELPEGSEVSVKPMGEFPDRRQVEFFVIGDDYMIARNELEAKMRGAGPFQMVDPWWGESTVAIEGRVRCSQTTRKGGMATFNFTAVRAREFRFPIIPEPSANLKAKAIKLELAVAEGFANKLSFGKFKRLVTSALSLGPLAMKVANGKIDSALGFVSDITNQIDDFDSELATLVQTPQLLANTMQDLWTSIFDLTKDLRDSAIPFGLDDGAGRGRGDQDPLAVTQDMMTGAQDFDAGLGDVSATRAASVDGKLLVANLGAVEFMVKSHVLAASAKSVSELKPDDAQFAAEFQEQIVGWVDAALQYEGITVEEEQALMDLKAAFVDYLMTEGLQAPEVSEVWLGEEVPALVLAHRIYGDATRDHDIIRRNAISDPMLVGGRVEVVNDG